MHIIRIFFFLLISRAQGLSLLLMHCVFFLLYPEGTIKCQLEQKMLHSRKNWAFVFYICNFVDSRTKGVVALDQIGLKAIWLDNRIAMVKKSFNPNLYFFIRFKLYQWYSQTLSVLHTNPHTIVQPALCGQTITISICNTAFVSCFHGYAYRYRLFKNLTGKMQTLILHCLG